MILHKQDEHGVTLRRGFGGLGLGLLFALALVLSLGIRFRHATQSVSASPERPARPARRAQSPASPVKLDPATTDRLVASYGRLPLSFEANRGQTDGSVRFLARGPGYTLFLTSGGADLVLRGPEEADHGTQDAAGRKKLRNQAHTRPILEMRLVGANPDAAVAGSDQLPGRSNYFLGKDSAEWHTNIPTYAKVTYHDVYPGVDLVYYGRQGRLEYDFVVAPGARPEDIAVDLMGGRAPRLDKSTGDLLAWAGGQEVRFHKPTIYQPLKKASAGGSSKRTGVEGGYAISAGGRITFEVGSYDKARPLVIDPALGYSTYLGGSRDDTGRALAVDASGNIYLAGSTCSANLPVVGPFQPAYGGDGGNCSPTNGGDAFVLKFDPTLSTLLYSTYLGGSGDDVGDGIALDSSDDAYVTGSTCSGTSFPITPGAYQTTYGGGLLPCSQDQGDAFVTELNPSGSALVYSTFVGGASADTGNAISLDASNNAYVVGTTCSANFPTTAGAFQTAFGGDGGKCGNPPDGDVFMLELNSTGSALVYSTYLGGSAGDTGYALALDSANNAYIAGKTYSANFPTTPGAFDTTCSGCSKSLSEAFVTKLNSTGTALIYSTYLGGSSGKEPCAACATGIAIDGAGNAYVSGLTSDSTDFPIVSAYQPVYAGGGHDVFATKLNPTGSALVYSTFLGGKGDDGGTAIAVDAGGNVYLRGNTASSNFPATPDAFQGACSGGCQTGDYDIYLSKLSPSGTSLLYSTFLGGTGDEFGKATRNMILGSAQNQNIYITGYSNSVDFPVTIDTYQPTNAGGFDVFVTTFIHGSNVSLSPTSLNFGRQKVGTMSAAKTVTLTNAGHIALTIQSIGIAGADSGDFSQTNTCDGSVAAQQTCTISVIFEPLALGQRTANVSITDNGGSSPQKVALSGFGTN